MAYDALYEVESRSETKLPLRRISLSQPEHQPSDDDDQTPDRLYPWLSTAGLWTRLLKSTE